MKSYEFTAKTVDKAIKEGLEQLGKNQEDVDIKIISEGGFFKKAKVAINVEEEATLTNFAVKAKEPIKVEEPKKEEIKQVEQKPFEQKSFEAKPVEIKSVEVKPVEENIVEKPTEIKEEKTELGMHKQREVDLLTPQEREKKFEERHFENNKTSVDFVQNITKIMGIDAKVSLEEKKDCSNIKIETEDAGKIIGYRGDCLNSIQYLSNIIEQKTNQNAKRVVVDTGDYKEKREESLRALAIKVAGKVEDSGSPYKLEPMNAYERRIIHTELQNYPSVETHSEGLEPHRRIIVTKK